MSSKVKILQHAGKSAKMQQTSTPDPVDEEHVSYSDDYYVRPYTCNFCNKGFSNAQALGGHMNIHRKDRAKLRQSPSSHNDLRSLNSKHENSGYPCASTEPEVCTYRPNSDLLLSTRSELNDVSGEREALPLFVDSPSMSKQDSSDHFRVNKDDSGVDLELRLGSGARSQK